jgi:hypothetical protein
MNAHRTFLAVTASAALLVLPAATTVAFDYTPTPLMKSVAEHPVVLVGKVVESTDGTVTVSPVVTIKGCKKGPYKLPAVWRPGTEFSFGPVRMALGKQYLLLLRADATGRLALSNDFASDGVTPVESTRDPIVRAAVVVHAFVGHKNDAVSWHRRFRD